MNLTDAHRATLEASGITADVIEARGYFSASLGNPETAGRLAEIGAKWPGVRKGTPGMIIPMYGPTGEIVSAQFRFDDPPERADGKKPLRYLSPKGLPNKLDVHPSNTDRIRDTSVRLWITEGVKKADALTARGECVVALTGVYNWRKALGTLGDWEDVPLRGREVIVCFDSDARDKRAVMLAMVRLGRWLKSKGARKVVYLVTPTVEGQEKTGADDYLADGGTVAGLLGVATTDEPVTTSADGTFSDAYLAETVASEVMEGRFRWSAGTGWITWDGRRWDRCDEAAVVEAVRLWAVDRFAEAVKDSKGDGSRTQQEVIDGWRSVLGRGRINALTTLVRGIETVLFDAADMDADPDVLNCRNGVADLRTGKLMPHDPERLISRMTGASYDPTAKSEDLDAILGAVPADVAEWLQIRFGQAATGHMTPDDVMPLLNGGGSNGKTTLVDCIGAALGDYHTLVPDGLLIGQASQFDLITLQGVRFALIEETPEAAHLDAVRLKKTLGSPEMRGAYKFKDSITWRATHSMFLTTNYRPLVRETDTGTWRRLALVRFPYTYVKGEPTGPHERKGDGKLRDRASREPEILAAMLRWIVDGARRFYEAGMTMPDHPESVTEDTRRWRSESDMILAYWDDQLAADMDAYVTTTDLYEHYREWSKARGNMPPSDKLFNPRFEEHSETTRARVEKRRIRTSQPGVSRPRGATAPLPAQAMVWVGISFRDDDYPFEK